LARVVELVHDRSNPAAMPRSPDRVEEQLDDQRLGHEQSDQHR
jgi:hypothetical protein